MPSRQEYGTFNPLSWMARPDLVCIHVVMIYTWSTMAKLPPPFLLSTTVTALAFMLGSNAPFMLVSQHRPGLGIHHHRYRRSL